MSCTFTVTAKAVGFFYMILWSVDISIALGKKSKFRAVSLLYMYYFDQFCLFCNELLECRNCTNFARTRASCTPKKIRFFWIFLLFFWILLFIQDHWSSGSHTTRPRLECPLLTMYIWEAASDCFCIFTHLLSLWNPFILLPLSVYRACAYP